MVLQARPKMKVIRRTYEEALLKFGTNNIGTYMLLIYHHLIIFTYTTVVVGLL